MSNIRWPTGYSPLRKLLIKQYDKLQAGTVLAIDPASGGSSNPGFAIFHAGELQCSGEIKLQSTMHIQGRLRMLYEKINTILPAPPDVFAIEQIRGQRFSHEFLRWAVGVSIAASGSPVLAEVPTNVWKALAKTDPNYLKGDESDAIMIGRSIILWSRELMKDVDS